MGWEMKCPKCDYVSFDYNRSCPKCGSGLSAEREKLNFPSYRPNPPFVLGALLGDDETPGDDTSMEELDVPESLEEDRHPDAEGLVIALEDLSNDRPETIRMERDEAGAKKIAAEDLPLADEKEPGNRFFWDQQALEERMSSTYLDNEAMMESEAFSGEGPSKEGTLPFQLEPLELDIQMEKPEKKPP